MKIRLLFRNIGIIMLANLFMGCTSQVAQPGNAAAQVPENPKIDNPATQQVSQQEEYMYKVLVAEIAGQRGHYALSAEYFFDVAKQTHDVYLAE
ncbi:MAG: hypothetical protein SVR94_17060, partial [Pseudomonadota bacterium]|nr:hypothetical protein [Pseudomonadota bacterium]